MLSPWSALPDDFELEEYLELYRDVLEPCPTAFAGCWAQACYPLKRDDARLIPTTASRAPTAIQTAAYREVRLDLGCGKGAFTVQCALREPDVLFIGIDLDPVCVAFAARLASINELHNVVFVPGRDGGLTRVFAPGELAAIYLNFPTPHPKGREAALRLSHAKRLVEYRQFLAAGGLLCLQTDNQPFYSYTLGQLHLAGYEILAASEDARSELPAMPETAYERRAIAAGAKICAIHATPLASPNSEGIAKGSGADALPTSLYDYLPSDLKTLSYVPPEMARGIAAIRRTAAARHQ